MILTVYDDYVVVSKASIPQKQLIRKTIAARPKGYQHMASFKNGTWDGYVSLYDWKKNRFPTGLLETVLNATGPCEITDTRKFPKPKTYNIAGFNPREYQTKSIQTALARKRGVLKLATNAGKTLVMAGIIMATGNKAVVIVPSRALLVQTADRLSEMLGITVGRMGAGYNEALDVTVTTIASLTKLIAKMKKRRKKNIVVLADECQHSRSDTVFNNVFDIPGPYRFGLSGTPIRHDVLSDLKLIGTTGPVIYEVTNAELISDGYSSKPTIFFTTIDNEEYDDELSYYEAYKRFIVQNKYRNQQIAKIAFDAAASGPVLVLTDWIEQAENVYAELREIMIGVSGEIATGRDSRENIEQKLSNIRGGTTRILIATDIFGEGIDVPVISSVVLAAGGKSNVKLLQRIGRGMRVTEDKSTLSVYDFIDSCNKHLISHSQERYSVCKEEGFRTKLISGAGTSDSVPQSDEGSVQCSAECETRNVS